MRITKQAVREAADLVASEGWERREVPSELKRAQEIRTLVLEQLADDVYSMRARSSGMGTGLDRIGREWVGHFHNLEDDDPEHYSPLWKEWSEDQLALQAGMAPFLDALPAEDRVKIRLTYDAGLSLSEMAEQLGENRVTIHRRLKAIHEKLRADLTRAFLQEVEVGA